MKKLLFSSLALLTCLSGGIYGVNDVTPTQMVQICENTLAKAKGHHKHDKKFFKHNIQLQLSDSLGFPVPGTEFWVTLEIVKQGPLVTIQIPFINFEVGPFANDPLEDGLVPLVQGGYLYTASGFLPKDLRPNSLIPPSIVAASNNGLSPIYSYTQDPSELPVPPVGYIVQVTNAGAIVVQGVGQFGNIISSIPTGNQVLMPCTLTYVAEEPKELCENFVISSGPSNITQFTDARAANNGYRDGQVNDVFDDVLAWVWGDNANVVDKTNNVLNAVVAIGRKDHHGKIHLRDPVQITNLSVPNTSTFNHAIAINRTNKKNIVVSYIVSDLVTRSSTYYRAASFDGGKTFPYNGPLNLGPPYQKPGAQDVGDALGVWSDDYGNIWYSGTIRFDGSGVQPTPGNLINQPWFAVSTDGGITFNVVYVVPLPDLMVYPLGTWLYDYPQIAMGGDGFGQQGFWFTTGLFDLATGDAFPCNGFIPVTGLGTIGTPTFSQLQGFTNVMADAQIAASNDGRNWMVGLDVSLGAYTYICPQNLTFHSPGLVDENNAGPWQTIVSNDNVDQNFATNVISYPAVGYFTATPKSLVYDNNRQALYSLFQAQNPDYSQNMNLYFSISRNNGMTWSHPLYIANSSFANRGYSNMALDPVSGDLVFGWYDGRKDKTYESVEYMGAVLTAKRLDKLVDAIPLSNPLFTLPSSALFPATP